MGGNLPPRSSSMNICLAQLMVRAVRAPPPEVYQVPARDGLSHDGKKFFPVKKLHGMCFFLIFAPE